jgi:hypothetical protein
MRSMMICARSWPPGLGDPDQVLICHKTGFLKKGTGSVGG